MDNEPDMGADDAAASAGAPRPTRVKPTKNLPTTRMSFVKQQFTLRGVAKASLAADRGSVSNAEVAQYADCAPTSVSNCNMFWIESGLVTREGNKIRPVEAVFEYDQAAEWTPEIAFTKLAPVLSQTWFGRAMITKLTLKSISVTDATVFLAQQCSASIEFKPEIELLLDYLEAAGLIVNDGNTIGKASTGTGLPPPPPPPPTPLPTPAPPAADSTPRSPAPGMRRITIALPSNEAVAIEFPEALNADDWILISDQLAGYIKRWKRFQPTAALKAATQDDDEPTAEGGDQ